MVREDLYTNNATMKLFTISTIVLLLLGAAIADEHLRGNDANALQGGGYVGIDISSAVSSSHFECMKDNYGVSYAITRCYRSTGSVDPNCISNLQNMKSAGISKREIYHFPDTSQTGAEQVAKLEQLLENNGETVDMVWLDIEEHAWSSNIDHNVALVQDIVIGMLSSKVFKGVGIYSSHRVWAPIMGTNEQFSNLPVWYAHYDSKQTFSDFQKFGGWTTPYMKQYKGNVLMCHAYVDMNWRQSP